MLVRLVVVCCAAVSLLGCGKKVKGPEPDDVLVFQAREAVVAGDKPKALELYNSALEIRGTPWAYFERGRLKGEMADPKGAMDDCAKGLEIEPDNRDLLWLRDELKKPKTLQFQAGSAPPRSSK